MIGTPVIILHQDVTDDNADDLRVGINSEAYYNISDGWYYVDGVIWNKTAQNLVIDHFWSVSCSYDILEVDDTGGVENNIKYDAEFTKLNFKHLALVDNPRYERANIVFNSKTFNISNYTPTQPRIPKGQPNGGQWVKDDALIQQKKDKLTPIEVKSEDIPQFESKEDLGNWFKSIFEDLGNVTISDTGIRIDLYGGNADREAFKRRFQQEPNKAVATAFEEVVTKSIKVDERQKDERHKHNQEIYYNKLKLGKDNYDVNLFVDYLEPNKEYRYAGHSTTKIDNKISTRDTQVINHIMLTKVDNSIINDLTINFNPYVKEHEEMNIQNWNEQDHPRDEQGKFTDKSGSSTKEKEITRDYHLMRTKDYVKTAERDDKKNILFTNDDETWLLTEVQDKGWELVKAGKVIKTFDDWYEANDAWEQGYFADVDSIDKKYDKQGNLINNNKEREMTLLDELKKLITKVENDKGEQSMTLKEKVLSILNSKEIDEETKKEIENAIDEEEKEVKEKKELEEKKEVKNEDKEPEKDEKKVDELKKDEKKDVDNKCDKKADNSVNNSKPDFFGRLNEIYNAAPSHLEEKSEYVSRADREKAADEYFAR